MLRYTFRVKRLLDKIQTLLLQCGVYISKSRDPRDVEDLLLSIWPVQTEHELTRLGAEERADGGYLVPNDLAGVRRVFSPGVSKTVAFEKWFLDQGIPCELIDGSISTSPVEHPLINFQRLWIARKSGAESISLDDWIQECAEPHEDLLLQMDVEGAEYETLLAAQAETLRRFRIIVIELHELRSVLSRMGRRVFLATLDRLKESHQIVHAHPNNCCPGIRSKQFLWPDTLELTFLRRDRIKSNHGLATLPHPLDRDNTSRGSIQLRLPPSQERSLSR